MNEVNKLPVYTVFTKSWGYYITKQNKLKNAKIIITAPNSIDKIY